jgi:formylglycine-generating enzyme required for sulfatase activity
VGVTADGAPEIEWMEIDAGEFIYGSDEVRYVDRYWIARYPVTNMQFDEFHSSELFADADVWGGAPEKRMALQQSAFEGALNPRDRISWFEACAFARWVEALLRAKEDSRLVGADIEVRLPSDIEWEKAARGVDGRLYPWGNDFDPTRCNTLETGLGRTCPVGIFPDGASPYGVEDMSGNVWEWCYNAYTVNDGTKVGRVNRGGSCFRDHRRAVVTYRHDCLPGYHSSGRGFRLVIGPRRPE